MIDPAQTHTRPIIACGARSTTTHRVTGGIVDNPEQRGSGPAHRAVPVRTASACPYAQSLTRGQVSGAAALCSVECSLLWHKIEDVEQEHTGSVFVNPYIICPTQSKDKAGNVDYVIYIPTGLTAPPFKRNSYVVFETYCCDRKLETLEVRGPI